MNARSCMKFSCDCTVAFAPRWIPALALLVACGVNPPAALAQFPNSPSPSQTLPNTGQHLTPQAVPGGGFQYLNPGLSDNPGWLAGQAVSAVTSPDHKTLLVLTSGYNLLNYTSGPNAGSQNNADSTEYVFVYNITNLTPVQTQVIKVPNTYAGIAFNPNGREFYVPGGMDDNVHIYGLGSNNLWSEEGGSPVLLGHAPAPPVSLGGVGLGVPPAAAGVAITADGEKLVVSNYYNDSITVLTKSTAGWTKSAELDLRPGKINSANSGVPGGEYPLWVSIAGSNTAYVSSVRDREIVVVNISGTPTVSTRIKVTGQPGKMVLNSAQTTLYAAEDESDSVAVINTATNTLTHEIGVTAPFGVLFGALAQRKGNNTNSVTLTPDEKYLYVTNGNMNDVAVVDLAGLSIGGFNLNIGTPVIGLIPTGWYPNSVAFNSDGSHVYVINGKSPTGPNSGNCHGGVIPSLPTTTCTATNQYDLQLIKAGLQFFPAPSLLNLFLLTQQVAQNNNFNRTQSAADAATMAFLHKKIQHVIYIIKENRTYDQVLGDLKGANGDPNLTEFGAAVTPNLHALASNFVALDNFFDSSEVSMDGWPWSTAARAPDVVEKQTPVNYAGRGVSYDSEGTNRNVNVSYASLTQRLAANPVTPPDPDILPGITDTAAPDGPNNQINTGHLWDQALRAGLTVRNYGFFIDLTRYQLPAPLSTLYGIPEDTDPFSKGEQVAYSTNAALHPLTDTYFRGFDNVFPDYYRYTEWSRDVDSGGLPQLSLLRLMHDHTGNFSTALNGLNTPELQVADNDYAVGLVVQKIASSQYAGNTLIFVIEDDAQDGGDHVDAHRSTAFVVGPYVKQHAVVSTSYNTVSMVRTIEEILGLDPLNLNDSVALPMTDVFNVNQAKWNYTATPSAMLYNTTLPLPAKSASLKVPKPTHNAAYWARVTKRLDFSKEDLVDPVAYNRILWQGLKGDQVYPGDASLSQTRSLYKKALKTAASEAERADDDDR
jgi:YVTN family beta-propeller protein